MTFTFFGDAPLQYFKGCKPTINTERPCTNTPLYAFTGNYRQI